MIQISDEVALAFKVLLNLLPQMDRANPDGFVYRMSETTILRADPVIRQYQFVDKEFGHTIMAFGITELKFLPRPILDKLGEDKDIDDLCFGLAMWAEQLTSEWGNSVARRSLTRIEYEQKLAAVENLR